MAAAPASTGCAAMAVYQLLIQDLVAEIDTFIADVDTRAGDQLAHLFLRLAAERALQQKNASVTRSVVGDSIPTEDLIA